DAVFRVVPLHLGRHGIVARPVHRQPLRALMRRVPPEHPPLEVTTRLVGRALLIERAPRPLRERVALDRLPELDRHILRPEVLPDLPTERIVGPVALLRDTEHL